MALLGGGIGDVGEVGDVGLGVDGVELGGDGVELGVDDVADGDAIDIVAGADSGVGDDVAFAYDHTFTADWSHAAYSISWSIVPSQIGSPADVLRIKLEVATTGWVGFGLAEAGGMVGADMVVAAIDDDTGAVTATDYYAEAKSYPMEDCRQDWQVLGGFQSDTDGVTTVELARLLDTGDFQDRAIRDDGLKERIVLAYGAADELGYHGSARHLYRVDFHQGETYVDPLARVKAMASIQTFDLGHGSDYVVPTATTTYHRSCFNVADLLDASADPAHIVGFDYFFTEETKDLNHHFVVTGHYGSNCAQDAEMENIMIWASGIEPYALPEDVGFRIGGAPGTGGYQSLMFETHFNNPEGLAELVDQSGARVYYTHELQTHDAGAFSVGDPNINLIGQSVRAPYSKFEFDCPGEMTTAAFPSPVTVFMSQLHMHAVGAKMEVTQIRDGVEIRSAKTEFYDFDFQDYVDENPWTVEPGDGFRTECFFNDPSGGGVIFGLGSENEMCINFMFYYPKPVVGMQAVVCGPGAAHGTLVQSSEGLDVSALQRDFGTPAPVCDAWDGIELSTMAPTMSPTLTPASDVTATASPTASATAITTNAQTASPTNAPPMAPTMSPTLTPTSDVTATASPTAITTSTQTTSPTNAPTMAPTMSPTLTPTSTTAITTSPTNAPTAIPTPAPNNDDGGNDDPAPSPTPTITVFASCTLVGVSAESLGTSTAAQAALVDTLVDTVEHIANEDDVLVTRICQGACDDAERRRLSNPDDVAEIEFTVANVAVAAESNTEGFEEFEVTLQQAVARENFVATLQEKAEEEGDGDTFASISAADADARGFEAEENSVLDDHVGDEGVGNDQVRNSGGDGEDHLRLVLMGSLVCIGSFGGAIAIGAAVFRIRMHGSKNSRQLADTRRGSKFEVENPVHAAGATPMATVDEIEAPPPPPPMPAGWRQCRDDDGNAYYISPTGVSQWECP